MEEKRILDVSNVNAYYTKENLSLFGKKDRKHICKEINFSIRKGEILGLLGESGCGKSTLAKTILGMTEDYTGEIIHYASMPQMVFQDPYGSLNPSHTVGRILEEPLRIQGGHTKEERMELVYGMLEKIGLEKKHALHYPRQLSGGQRQRVAIGAALMLKPKFLIADEPVSALDVTVQVQILNLLLALQKDMELSMLFISHDLRVVYKMSDRIMVMKEGEVMEIGTPEELYHNPKTNYMKQLLKSANIS